MAVVQVVVAHVRMHVLVHVLGRARRSAQVHANMGAMEVVHPIASDLAWGVVVTVKTLAKVDALETPETHQIHAGVVPHVHQHTVFLVKTTALMDVVEIVVTNVPQHAPIRVLEIVLVLHLVVLAPIHHHHLVIAHAQAVVVVNVVTIVKLTALEAVMVVAVAAVEHVVAVALIVVS